MPEPTIEPDSDLQAVMDAQMDAQMDAPPATVAVFRRRRMHCPARIMAPFATPAVAAASDGVDTGELAGDLRVAACPRPGGQA